MKNDCQGVPPRPVTPHSILAQKLHQLASQAGNAADLSDDFRQELQTAALLATGLEPYIHQYTTPESPALSMLSLRTQAEDWQAHFNNGQTVKALEQEMLSGHTEGQFLKLLLHGMKASKVLEIGVFTGYSALAMAEALPDDGLLIACEIDTYAAEFAQTCFDLSPHGHKIQLKIGPALNTVQALAEIGEVFDFVFIDANKDGYLDYLDILLESTLLAPHALVCVDNTLMQGQPYMLGESTPNGKAIAQFNQAVAADPRVEQVILPLRDGVTLIRRS